MMRALISSACLLLCATTSVQSSPVQWTVGSGGNGHWYEFVTKEGFNNWSDAAAAAAARVHMGMSGYLATITSAAEQAFLNTLYPGSYWYWLGGSDAAQEGSWVWVTEPGGGVPFSYTYWAAGEPNNYFEEDYLIGWFGQDGRWNDLPISYGYGLAGYVVEYDSRTGPGPDPDPDPGPAPVPLPAGGALLLLGLAALGAAARRRSRG